MQLQNTFKQQRKLQNEYDRLLGSIDDLPMDDKAKETMRGTVLEQFKSEAKKLIDETKVVADAVKLFEVPPISTEPATVEDIQL